MGVNISDGVGFCIFVLLVVLSRFDSLGGDMECVLVHSPSEVGMVTPSEGCVSGWSVGGFGSAGIMTGVFDLVMRWCVHGAKRICVDAVGVDEVWFGFVGVGVILYAVVPIFFDNCCNASPWCP